MNHNDFTFGCEFTTCAGERHWRCTDLGARVVVAIRIDGRENRADLIGPPYSVQEVVFDEYDFGGCDPA